MMFDTLHCGVSLGVARPTHSTKQCSLSLMQCACVITESMPSMGNKIFITPLLEQYPIYKHQALEPTALGLGACKSDIALTGM